MICADQEVEIVVIFEEGLILIEGRVSGNNVRRSARRNTAVVLLDILARIFLLFWRIEFLNGASRLLA